MKKTNCITILLTTIAIAATAAAQREETFSRTLDVGERPELSLSNVAGDIHVEGVSGSQIAIEAVKRLEGGADQALLDSVEIDVSQLGNRIRVETRHSKGRSGHHHGDGGVSVSYRVRVPKGTEVELQSVSGNVTVMSVDGEATAASVSGDVDVRDMANLAEAKSVSGEVTVRRARSARDVDIASVSGSVDVDDIESRELDVSSVSGDVNIGSVSCERASLESVSGDIGYTGRILSGGRYEFQSHSGDVVITIGDDVGFVLEASTYSGDIESDLPLQSTSSGRRRHLSGTFGDGSAIIEAQTFSGDVRIRKR
jgi:DUF4097 and DUF4098 domain-containing protein YvlB